MIRIGKLLTDFHHLGRAGASKICRTTPFEKFVRTVWFDKCHDEALVSTRTVSCHRDKYRMKNVKHRLVKKEDE